MYNIVMARQIIKEPIDNKPIKAQDPIGHILNALDRCDRCSAQAYVMVKGSTGELLFCGHHYDKIMNNPDAYTKMMAFMLEVVDERDKLIENRLVGSHN
jgi:hypothetical protein